MASLDFDSCTYADLKSEALKFDIKRNLSRRQLEQALSLAYNGQAIPSRWIIGGSSAIAHDNRAAATTQLAGASESSTTQNAQTKKCDPYDNEALEALSFPVAVPQSSQPTSSSALQPEPQTSGVLASHSNPPDPWTELLLAISNFYSALDSTATALNSGHLQAVAELVKFALQNPLATVSFHSLQRETRPTLPPQPSEVETTVGNKRGAMLQRENTSPGCSTFAIEGRDRQVMILNSTPPRQLANVSAHGQDGEELLIDNPSPAMNQPAQTVDDTSSATLSEDHNLYLQHQREQLCSELSNHGPEHEQEINEDSSLHSTMLLGLSPIAEVEEETMPSPDRDQGSEVANLSLSWNSTRANAPPIASLSDSPRFNFPCESPLSRTSKALASLATPSVMQRYGYRPPVQPLKLSNVRSTAEVSHGDKRSRSMTEDDDSEPCDSEGHRLKRNRGGMQATLLAFEGTKQFAGPPDSENIRPICPLPSASPARSTRNSSLAFKLADRPTSTLNPIATSPTSPRSRHSTVQSSNNLKSWSNIDPNNIFKFDFEVPSQQLQHESHDSLPSALRGNEVISYSSYGDGGNRFTDLVYAPISRKPSVDMAFPDFGMMSPMLKHHDPFNS